MKDLIIVDGYNFIFNYYKAKKISSDDLAYLRGRLISDLSQYKNYKGCSIIVVFDAKKARVLARAGKFQNKSRLFIPGAEKPQTQLSKNLSMQNLIFKIFT